MWRLGCQHCEVIQFSLQFSLPFSLQAWHRRATVRSHQGLQGQLVMGRGWAHSSCTFLACLQLVIGWALQAMGQTSQSFKCMWPASGSFHSHGKQGQIICSKFPAKLQPDCPGCQHMHAMPGCQHMHAMPCHDDQGVNTTTHVWKRLVIRP